MICCVVHILSNPLILVAVKFFFVALPSNQLSTKITSSVLYLEVCWLCQLILSIATGIKKVVTNIFQSQNYRDLRAVINTFGIHLVLIICMQHSTFGENILPLALPKSGGTNTVWYGIITMQVLCEE